MKLRNGKQINHGTNNKLFININAIRLNLQRKLGAKYSLSSSSSASSSSSYSGPEYTSGSEYTSDDTVDDVDTIVSDDSDYTDIYNPKYNNQKYNVYISFWLLILYFAGIFLVNLYLYDKERFIYTAVQIKTFMYNFLYIIPHQTHFKPNYLTPNYMTSSNELETRYIINLKINHINLTPAST